MRRSAKIACVVAGVAALATPAAFAAIPDSDDGEYHACVADDGGARLTYLIDDQGGGSCPTGFTEKTWPNQGFSGAELETVTEQASCGSPPVNTQILVDLPSNKRGIWAHATTGSLSTVGASTPGDSPDSNTYHLDAQGRIDGVYMSAAGAGSCPGTNVLTATAKVLMYEVP